MLDEKMVEEAIKIMDEKKDEVVEEEAEAATDEGTVAPAIAVATLGISQNHATSDQAHVTTAD